MSANAAPHAGRSCAAQTRSLLAKNWAIQKRKPTLTAAEYFVVVCYMLFYYKLLYVIFPDDRLSAAEVADLARDLDQAIPSACSYLALGGVAFVGEDDTRNAALAGNLYAGCGLVVPNTTVPAVPPAVLFASEAAFRDDYAATPMKWVAAVSSSSDGRRFTILHNETLKAGRYVPRMDETTLQLKDPPFEFVPVLTTRGYALNFWDNRLADLQYRTHHAVQESGAAAAAAAPANTLSVAFDATGFPFDKPECDGAGCAMMYIIPQLIAWIYLVTMQSLLTSLGREKERSIKESLLLSGMSQRAYFGSWFLSKMVDSVPPTLVWTAGAYALQCIEHQWFFPVLGVTYLYAFQTIAFSLFVQTMFKTQQSMFYAAILLLMVISLAYYPIRLLGIDKEGADLDALTLTFLLPAVPISHFYWELVEAEGKKIQMDYSDPMIARSIWMQIVSGLFWLLLFVYLEQILPQAHGPAHQSDPLFCCKAGGASKHKVGDEDTENAGVELAAANDEDVAANPAAADGDDADAAAAAAAVESGGPFMGIRVTNLVMEFDKSTQPDDDTGAHGGTPLSPEAKRKLAEEKAKKAKQNKGKKIRAVDNLSCDFVQGEITAVLGHNGAGKTTSIRCITGGLTPTSGQVVINGRNVLSSASGMDWLRRNVGVCPQHDVLYDELTAREHVVLFGAMRGMAADASAGARDGTEDLVSKALGGVDMLGKADELVSSFSGGQKRRLSVALALLGDPTVVILDEPTTGMDVITRQAVWKSIQRLRGKATIILTTHAMEEADALGDRVVVLSRGKVQTQGTSLDLKKRFGVGFHLHVVTKDRGAEPAKEGKEEAKEGSFDADMVAETLRSHVDAKDQVEVLTNVGTECSLTLPSETDKFPALFDELEERRDALGIEQLALSMTTLEEVFLKLGQLEQKEAEEAAKKEAEEAEEAAKKKGKDKKKKKKGDGDEQKDDDGAAKTAEADDAGEQKTDTPTPAPDIATAASGGSWSQQVRGVALLNLYSKKRNPMTSCALCVQPIIFVCVAGIIHLTTAPPGLLSTPIVPFVNNHAKEDAKGGDDPFRDGDYEIAWASDARCDAAGMGSVGAASVTAMSDAVAAAMEQAAPSLDDKSTKVSVDYHYTSRALVEADLKAGTIGQEGNKYTEFAVACENATAVTLLVSDKSKKLREMVAALTNALPSTNSSTVPTYKELPKGNTAQIQAAAWGSGGIMVLCALPIAFMSAFYGERLIRDRVGGNRVHLFVSSLRRTQYYAGNFIVDCLIFLPVAVLTPILLVCFQFDGVLKTNIWSFFWIFVFFAPSVIGFGYLVQWIFSDVQTAQEWFGEIINFGMAIPFLITGFVILDATEVGHALCGIVPGYAIYRGFSVLEGEAKGGRPYETWEDMFSPDRSLVWVFVIMIIDAVFFWSLILLVEKLEASCGRCKDDCRLRFSGHGEALDNGNSNFAAVGGGDKLMHKPDPHVQAEISRVQNREGKLLGGTGHENVGLQVAGLSKTFVMNDGRLNRAVKEVCLGVQEGEVFGLLGMNGAGKTTLLHAIQGKHVPSGGDCYVAAPDGSPLSCQRDVDRVRQLFGICPQHDVLWEFVTPREHLRAFAHIRGVDRGAIEAMVKALLERLDLSEKADEPAGTLSGGMKRRLSIAMAVIGSPRVIFLDE